MCFFAFVRIGRLGARAVPQRLGCTVCHWDTRSFGGESWIECALHARQTNVFKKIDDEPIRNRNNHAHSSPHHCQLFVLPNPVSLKLLH